MARLYSTCIILVHVILITGTYSASLCEDKSKPACERLVAIQSNICQDNCIATLCPKTCGKCPLTCFSCEHVDHPSDCHNTTICGDKTMSCIATQTVTQSLTKEYQLGCVNNQICNELFGSVPNRTLSKRTINLLGGCCGSDLCNKYEEPDKVPIPTIQTVNASSNIYGFGLSNKCKQIDDSICTQLKQDVGCQDACVSEMCPMACDKCNLRCYNCSAVDEPRNCRHTIFCNHQQESCATFETNINGYHNGHRLGCTGIKECNDLLSAGVTGTCCSSNFCNGFYTQAKAYSQHTTNTVNQHHTTETIDQHHTIKTVNQHHTTKAVIHHTTKTVNQHHTTKAVTHHSLKHLGLPTGCQIRNNTHTICPDHFIRKGHSCYYIGNRGASQVKAWTECNNLCSRLAIISNEPENRNIAMLLADQVAKGLHYWIDGHSFDGVHWIWNSTKTTFHGAYTHWKSKPRHHKNSELCLSLEAENADHGLFWRDKTCDHTFRALCEYPISDLP